MKKMCRGWIAPSVALCVAAMGLAGCGSSSSSSSSAGSTGSTAPSKNDIAIGLIGQFSGAVVSTYGGIPNAMQAWEKSVNDAGGIKGRHVRIVTKDVGSASGADVTAARSLIQQDKVIAIVSFDQSDASWVKYAASNTVPVISGVATPAALVTPDVFSVGINSVAAAYAVVAEGKKIGPKFALGYPAEIATAAQIGALVGAFGKITGVNVVITAKLSSSLPDYTPFCQQLKSAGADSYLLGLAGAVTKKISDQCLQQNIHTPQILLGPNVNSSWKDDPSFSGSVVVDGVAPFFDTSIPGVADYRNALQKYEPGFIGSSTDTSIPGFAWASAKLIETSANAVDGDLTGKTLQDALFNVKNETLNGLTSPLTFTRDKTTSINCWFTWKISDGKYVSVNGTTPSCAPDDVINPVLAEAAKGIKS